MNQNTVTRDDCMLIAGGPYGEEIRRLARAYLELLDKITWRCFHCGFETDDRLQAAGHFGDCDDAEPICTLWGSLSEDERVGLLQTSSGQYLEAQNEISAQNVKIEGLEYRLDGQLSEIHSFKPFRTCDTIHQVFNVYDSVEGRALAAEEQRDELRSQKAALESQLAESKKRCEELRIARKVTKEQLAEARELLRTVMPTLASKADEVSFADCKNPDCPIGCPDSHCLDYEAGFNDAAGALRAKPEAWKPSDPVWPPK